MQVSFIIPLYNCLTLTQECLRTLQATLPAGLAHEIIFVDDGSTDGTREWLAGLPNSPIIPAPCRVILNERNLGFAATCNRGAAAARGDFLFFLNSDLVFLPGWFQPMRSLARHRRVALVGNVQLNATTGAVDHTGIFFNPKGKPQHETTLSWWARLVGVRRVTALTGACFAIRRKVWVALGGFDEGFINGSEDIDLCLRARQSGYHHCVALRSVVRHHISASPGRKSRDEQNSRRLLLRWRTVIARQIARAHAPDFLTVAWEEPRQYLDPALARDAFIHRWCCWPRPSWRLALAADAVLEIEVRRWSHVLDGGPPPPAPVELVWQLRQAQRVPETII